MPWSLELQLVELQLNYITIKLRGFPAFGKYRYLARFAHALMHHFDCLAPGRTLRIIELTAALDPLRLPEIYRRVQHHRCFTCALNRNWKLVDLFTQFIARSGTIGRLGEQPA